MQFKTIVTTSLLALFTTFSFSQSDVPSEVLSYADIVLYNGQVLAGEDFSPVQAVAIRDAEFLAVGEDQLLLKMAGPNTLKIDLQGKTVLPGFIDTHLHQAWVGNIAKGGPSGRVNFREKQSGLEEVRQIVSSFPPSKWLYLNAPDSAALYETTRQDLDRLAPRNPLVISVVSNWAVVNSLALEHIPAETAGIIKDPDTGKPTGLLWGWAVGVVQYELMPWPNIEELLPEQKERLAILNSQGLTTIVGRSQGLQISIINELRKRGELTARIRFAHEFLRQNPNGEAYLKRLGNLVGFGDDWMKIVGTTLSPVDGITSSGTTLTSWAQIRRPEDTYAGPYGFNKWEAASQDRTQTEWYNIILANRYGWNVTNMHSGGDLSTKISLEAYRDASREKPLQGVWGIDHQAMQTPETLQMLKDLNVIPSVYFLMPGGSDGSRLAYLYGADRVNQMVPVKTMIEMGLKPVIESDTMREGQSAPLWNLERFVTRKDGKGKLWGPQEKLDRLTVLHMYTDWAARYSLDEGRLGLIQPGMLADCVVLDGDFLNVPEDQLDEIPVVHDHGRGQ